MLDELMNQSIRIKDAAEDLGRFITEIADVADCNPEAGIPALAAARLIVKLDEMADELEGLRDEASCYHVDALPGIQRGQ